METHQRIRNLREDRDLSQKQVADILCVGQRTYSDYETGRTRIPIDCLIKLAEFYDISMDYVSGASRVASRFPRR
ncbi:MAG: helix-turn-helix transcriptional regulator [Lachnospiraceae bacterium]|nr:helix-turn-helix transcriptional regulator [Lachnospiraceae bacterium]